MTTSPQSDVKIHHPEIARLVADDYTHESLAEVRARLDAAGTLRFTPLASGLFSAAHLSAENKSSGYGAVWVRDNIHVAHALWRDGAVGQALATLRALLAFFARGSQSRRFRAIIAGKDDAHAVENRPHIRFNGEQMAEIDEPWSHAQNDALGYLLWFACRLIAAGVFVPDEAEREIVALLPPYFAAVRYWEDADSGHWEEERKVEASSIGVVVAALAALWPLVADRRLGAIDQDSQARLERLIPRLIGRGRAALGCILPAESIDLGRERAYDAALLFLIYPLDVVEPLIAETIVANVEKFLMGRYGIRRYLLDSFWCAGYDKVDDSKRTIDVSRDMSWRNALVALGDEAQWCIFDPILSVIYGRRFLLSGDRAARVRQIHHFNRSLGQLTGPDCRFKDQQLGELRCPELYYRSGGQYLPNNITPLLWTQANLLLAFAAMRATIAA